MMVKGLKKRLCIEYPLKKVSVSILWTSIGTSTGLSEWFANEILVSGNEYTFIWEKNSELVARQLDCKMNRYNRFQWIEDMGTEAYFEIRIENEPITGQLSLLITDYVEDADKQDHILLWNKNIDNLKHKIGI